MNQTADFTNAVAWNPTPEIIERAQITKFMRQIGAATHDELHKFSVANVEQFTAEVFKFLEIEFTPEYSKLLDASNGIQFPKWCADGGLNITEMCLDRWQTIGTKNQPAVIWENEAGATSTVTYAQLLSEVENTAIGLRLKNLGKGDAIGVHLPMAIETVVVLLAINRIGAIAVPVFSGYGADAIASRIDAVSARALITCDGFMRRGKEFLAFETAAQAVEKCPTLEKIFVYRFLGSLEIREKYQTAFSGKFASDTLATDRFAAQNAANPERDNTYVEQTDAEDPLIILYTSGTTGKPKGIAHTHCGFPIKAAQDMAFGTDVGQGTRISWLTDLGWMMGPWLIYGALIRGATICIYDGAPDYPNADRLWEFTAKHQVEVLGVSPTLIRSLMTHGDELPLQHDLSSLRLFASTGETWNETPWQWLFEKVGKSRLPIINYSGGTEISGGILMGNPILPIKPCSFPAACPGIDAAILDAEGNDVERGKVGELAIKKPWIGMARGFWLERERYLETYWSRFENVWVHGDFALRDADGHYFILGRSDDTLKIAGKRVGPAEVETLLVAHAAVTEAAVIGVPDELKGTAMIAFCVVAQESEKSETLETELKNVVAEAMGKPLKPSRILFVSAIPKTRNGKVMRRVIRAAFLGEDAGDLSALENPKSVEELKNLR